MTIVIKELIDRFKDNEAEYMRSTYLEANVQREFIEPFFEALGWDIQNKQGAAEAYKPVVHQPRLRDQERNVAPDYAFRVGQGTLSERKRRIRFRQSDCGTVRPVACGSCELLN